MKALADPHNDTLIVTLELAVPLRLIELAEMTEARREQTRMRWAREGADEVGSGGDSLMFRTPTKERRHGDCATCGGSISLDRGGWYHVGNSGREPTCADGRTPRLEGGRFDGTAASFNALARGLAALAWQPGGVTFLGRHWCVLGCSDCPGRAA